MTSFREKMRANRVSPDDFTARFPTVWHVAARDSWPGIEQHGLLSTTALLDLFEVSPDYRERIERMRRPDAVRVTHPVRGTAEIRDNKPLNDALLERCLDPETSPSDWYQLLNGRVFF